MEGGKALEAQANAEVVVTRSVVRRPPSCETPSLKVGAVSQLVSSPSHGMKEAALEGRTMSPANVTFCQVRVRAGWLQSWLWLRGVSCMQQG